MRKSGCKFFDPRFDLSDHLLSVLAEPHNDDAADNLTIAIAFGDTPSDVRSGRDVCDVTDGYR